MRPIPVTFDDWVEAVFTKAEHRESLDQSDALLAVEYVTTLFREPAFLLDRFSRRRISNGLFSIVRGADGKFAVLLNDGVPVALRRECVQSIGNLYEKLFAVACTDDPDGSDVLNSVCFMLWDVAVVYGGMECFGAHELKLTAPTVMESALRLPNIQCQRSALHGLGHWHDYEPVRVQQVISDYLRNQRDTPAALREYAMNARDGMVL